MNRLRLASCPTENHVSCTSLVVLGQAPSLQKLFGNVASVLGKFLQHRLVQPDIHLRRIAHFLSWAPQFSRQFFSGDETAIEAQEFHQVHD
jgi:hypothetical protein